MRVCTFHGAEVCNMLEPMVTSDTKWKYMGRNMVQE